jgi:hypothetical protein
MDRRLVLIAACVVPADQPVVAFLERGRGEQGYLFRAIYSPSLSTNSEHLHFVLYRLRDTRGYKRP